MANNAFICRRRTDLGSGSFQILDLLPNASQRSLVYEPNPQTGYLPPRVENETLAALAANKTTAQFKGVAAYLIDHCIDQVTGVTITVTVANDAAAAFVAQVDAGSAIDINAAMVVTGGAGAGTTLTNAAGSNGSLKELLKVLGGGSYILPKDSTVGGLAVGAKLGSFADDLAVTNSNFAPYQEFFVTGALQISCGEGQLAGFASSSFSYKETSGAALVVYDENGNVLT